MRCPECGGRSIGRVAKHQFYCWDCCIEFKKRDGQPVEVYHVDMDGTLVAIEEG